ncbi:hypothetical protein VTN77DRAFT_8531 [Rasamsonia byssochlamydoides]|uniref:uncharacterized protein n=1 Tax=Rasamsonia byssochlamydoides TaxID=89139 RepID=UPI003742495D
MLSSRQWQLFCKRPYQGRTRLGLFRHILKVFRIYPAARKDYSVKPDNQQIVDNKPKINYESYASQDLPKPHPLVDSSLVEIVSGNRDPGVKINSYGQLRITSDEKSLRNNKTILVLSRASASLTIYDFRRLLSPGVDEDAGEGFEEVFPVRHTHSLKRQNSWILIFGSPAQAKKYQDRASKLREFAAQYAPRPCSSNILPSPDLTVEGQSMTFKPQEYTIASPFQELSLVAQLSPFDHKVRRAISSHVNLLGPNVIDKQSFPVRFWIDFPGRPILTVKAIQGLLELDSRERGHPWRLSSNQGAIVRIEQVPVSPSSPENFDEQLGCSTSTVADNWRVNFKSASDAKRFTRLWHRRRLPKVDNLLYYNPHIIVKAECLV